MKQIIVFLIIIVYCECIYLNNSNIKSVDEDNPAIWTENGIWGPLIEEWALIGPKTYREQRVMKLIPVDNKYTLSNNRKDSQEPGKVLNGVGPNSGIQTVNPPSTKPPIPSLDKPVTRQITETDLYLLGAIEKLVYRTDFMEKRLRRVEEMLYYVMAGSRVDQEPCPDNYTRAGSQCYYFSDYAGREKDWKTASKLCQRMGAVLAEMETIEENQDVVAHIQTNSNLKGKDFWTGGLNPGLLWIWSNSARPVSTNKNQNTNTSPIKGDGRCLRLAYDPAYRNYAYRGTDCSARYQYICELPDKTTSNKLNRISRELNLNL